MWKNFEDQIARVNEGIDDEDETQKLKLQQFVSTIVKLAPKLELGSKAAYVVDSLWTEADIFQVPDLL